VILCIELSSLERHPCQLGSGSFWDAEVRSHTLKPLLANIIHLPIKSQTFLESAGGRGRFANVSPYEHDFGPQFASNWSVSVAVLQVLRRKDEINRQN
jgi:hypothetical protein